MTVCQQEGYWVKRKRICYLQAHTIQ